MHIPLPPADPVAPASCTRQTPEAMVAATVPRPRALRAPVAQETLARAPGPGEDVSVEV